MDSARLIGLARAVHTHHDRPHVSVQAAAARPGFDRVGVVITPRGDQLDRHHAARHHASFIEGPPGAMLVGSLPLPLRAAWSSRLRRPGK